MSREEDDADLIVQQAMQKDGVVIVLDAKVIRVEKDSSDRLVVVSRAGGEERVRGDQILVGIGRTPNLDGLGLEAVGVASHPQHGVEVDHRVYCKKYSDQILGATIVAAHAGDMIGEIVMAMKHRIGLGKIASTIHPYPTQAEAVRKLGDQFNRTKLTPTVKSLF